jgi:integrase
MTPHKLRHTFASLLVALGIDPGAVMDQLGHTDPTFTLRTYRGMRRDQTSRAALRELVGVEATGSDVASIGQRLGSSREIRVVA